MITAGEPQEFIPFGRKHLKIHPGDVYLLTENVPVVPAESCKNLSQDLLKAFLGVSLKDRGKEQWFIKDNPEDECEEEFFNNDRTVIWSKSNGHGIRRIHKSFTMEDSVHQVLWAEFRIRSCKPRIADSAIEMEEQKQDVLSGVCIIQNSTISVFAKSGEDFIVTTPFQVLRAWSSKYGIMLERNVTPDKNISNPQFNQPDNLPVMFSMMHPLDDIAPVIKKTIGTSSSAHISYFCDPLEEIVFCSFKPSLVMTYKSGIHSVWRLRTTTFQEVDYACTKIQMDTKSNFMPTPVTPSSKSNNSRLNLSHHTPPVSTNSPFRSYSSSRIASPSLPSRSWSPTVSSLTHMATLSRSQPPSMNSSSSHQQSFTPLSSLTHRNPISPVQTAGACKFIEPLAPDICFDHEWSDTLKGQPEKACKAFLSMDITGHNFLCYFLKEHGLLNLVKFEENDSGRWVFGNTTRITALDAECLPDLNLIITVDTNFTLSLYTGLTKVSKVMWQIIFGPTLDIPSISSNVQSVNYATPRRESFVSSTRPPSATGTRFGDESHVLSPVPMIINDSSPKSVLNEEISFLHVGPVKSLKDAVQNRVTLETTAGDYRLQIPEVSVSRIVQKCLDALKYVLPRDIYTQIFVKWYSNRNAPGPSDINNQLELNSFLSCLLNAIGFDSENIILGNFIKHDSLAPVQPKKQKTHEKGSDDDWLHVLSTNLHLRCVELTRISPAYYQSSTTADLRDFNGSAILYPYITDILFALHLVYEDSKLDVTLWNDLSQMCSFLCELASYNSLFDRCTKGISIFQNPLDCAIEELPSKLQLELRQYTFLDLYWKDFPDQFKCVNKKHLLSEDQIKKIPFPSYFSTAPSVYNWIKDCLCHAPSTSFPYIPNVTKMLCKIVLAYAILTSESPVKHVRSHLTPVMAPGIRAKEVVNDNFISSCYTVSTNPKKASILFLTKIGFTKKDLNSLPVGIAVPIKDAILHCWHEPSGLWSKDMFNFIGRCDLSSLESKSKIPTYTQSPKTKQDIAKNGLSKDVDEGLNHLDMEVLRLRFSQDHRIHDVYHMLQSSKPVRISLQQRPEVSDHEFIEEQERHLYNLCIRTMAATVGRGMFTLRTYNPVVTETLPIPKLCLTGRAPPRNTTVDLSHIDVPANMNMWPLFHNGVAAGLTVSQNASKIDSTWIVYNKPRSSSSDTPTEHAGFLMGLGLNGHLSRLTTLSIHDYLSKGHELTSVGILLGISAAKRGTMDLSATKMLSIHIEALLPPTSTELDVAPAVQVAAVMGLGLLYQGSGHHHMAEVLLGEIGRPPGPEMEHCIDRESYSLAAGLALGLVTLGKGKEMSGVADLPMADQLYHYMVGGHKRPLTGIHKEKHKSPSYQIREGDNVNVDVTSPGATLALGMMFFDTGNQAIADWMSAPDTQFLLDMVRPDFLLLRTLSKGLILWSTIYPSVKWIESHLPQIVSKHAFQRGVTNADVDYETMSQAYCNIIAGGCFCIGLKFAGSANAEAFDALMHYAKSFLSLSRKLVVDQACRSAIETCLNVIVLSLSMVMAGTGDLDVIRICRHLRSRISQASSYVLYGSHMVTHMALGLLFLGGGRLSLSTSPLAIGALVCAFFPKFPQHSNDNRYHLQAFYHLYVLAVEPRLLVPRLIGSNKPVYINIKVKFKDTEFYKNAEFTVKAPCLLPELKFLKQVIIEDSRYWPIVFDCDENWNVLCNLLENGGSIHVMQNAGCLPYNEDPQGFRSLLAQSYIWNNVHAWNIKNVEISNFSSDPVALNFASCFLKPTAQSEQEKEWQQKMCGFLFECATLEKMEALPICVAMIQMSKQTDPKRHTFELWQLKMITAYERWIKRYTSQYNKSLTLLRPEFSLSISNEMRVFNDMKGLSKYICSLKNMEPKLDYKMLKYYLLFYLTENWKSVDNVLVEFPSPLAAFLLVHDVNNIRPIAINCNPSELSLPYLYNLLRGCNLSISSLMSILSVLS